MTGETRPHGRTLADGVVNLAEMLIHSRQAPEATPEATPEPSPRFDPEC